MRRYNDYFGSFGGRYVAEMLRTPLDELEEAFLTAMSSTDFPAELQEMLRDFAGRPTPLLFAKNATRELGGALGAGLVLANTGIFPVSRPLFDLPVWMTNTIGLVLFLSGLAFVAYQLTRPRLPD